MHVPTVSAPLGPARRCDKMLCFAVILEVLEAAQAIADHRRSPLKYRSSMASQLLTIARATRCDAAHLRWCVQKGLRCLKIACDVLR